MKAGTKVSTPDGPGTVVKSKNGIYIVWIFVKLDSGDTHKYNSENIKKIA